MLSATDGPPPPPDAAVPAAAGPGEAGAAAETALSAVGDAPATWSDTLLTPAISFITAVHDATGLPWWGTIAVATLTVRTMILPISVYTMRNASKMAAIQDDLKVMREEVMDAVKSGNRSLAQQKQGAQREFMRAAGISPGRVLLGPLVQFPVFISFFIGIRRMAENNPEFVTGGVSWFVDLSAKDPAYGLPVLAGLTLAAMTEMGGDTGTKMTPTMRLAMRIMAVASVPMTSWMPAAVFCYWIPNNVFSVCLGGAMRSPALKRRLGLDVNPAHIAGTKAAQKAARESGLGRSNAPLTAAAAAASYVRKNVAQADAGAAAALAKPVLLSRKPAVKRKAPKVVGRREAVQ
jgi:YidC/Oxa1 family membrane protein insertase